MPDAFTPWAAENAFAPTADVADGISVFDISMMNLCEFL
jgi:hypothetical protein